MIKKAIKLISGLIEDQKFYGLMRDNATLVKAIKKKNLTYLSVNKIFSIINTCEDLSKRNVSGIFIEAGCALGGSSILLSKLKPNEKRFLVYDVFGMIPPPTDEDTPDIITRYKTIVSGDSKGLGGNKYYGYEENLYEKVKSNLESFSINLEKENIHLIKGLVQDTMTIDEPVAFAHIDVDWYEPVKTCLERIYPNLVIGGSIILDDYNDWGGCKKATDEFLEKRKGEFKLDNTYSSLKIIKL